MGIGATREEIFAKRIGQALALARGAAAMTQEDVSEALDVNTETISRFERGHTLPPLSRLFELATLYGVEPETLVAGGATRSLEPATDITVLMGGLSDEDREFVREWVVAMCARLSRSPSEKS
ncbi:helix-turn-helix domain-containing protein [Paraburkholderia sp. BCC1885]|uniref:helix-turn-helix domain-containing protein n=1 Tax=Paraburkholderia sp. BCC1885 TaxID=2562669 RepID=UPI0011842C27|nr:helix-turn-helix transcriptional regulator [Paraburkholderia sp. BCC1885]